MLQPDRSGATLRLIESFKTHLDVLSMAAGREEGSSVQDEGEEEEFLAVLLVVLTWYRRAAGRVEREIWLGELVVSCESFKELRKQVGLTVAVAASSVAQ